MGRVGEQLMPVYEQEDYIAPSGTYIWGFPLASQHENLVSRNGDVNEPYAVNAYPRHDGPFFIRPDGNESYCEGCKGMAPTVISIKPNGEVNIDRNFRPVNTRCIWIWSAPMERIEALSLRSSARNPR